MKIGAVIDRCKIYRAVIPVLALCLTALLPAGCESKEVSPVALILSLSSTAFQEGGSIPDRYTCEGQDVSPQLSWGEPPAGTESLVLIVDDIDTSGKFTHWVIFNIPANSRELAEAVPAQSL